MKLIIWWSALMVILPLTYLFWWKKRWRLLFGVIILTVLVISYIAPGEIAHSILTTETEKEKPLNQLKDTLKSISNDEPKPADPEKLKFEKSIIRLEKEIKKDREEMMKRKLSEAEISELIEKSHSLQNKSLEWVEKWGKKENAPALLFCGEEFNEQLMREKKSGNNSWKAVKDYNIIDFGQAENNKLDIFKKKIQEICKKWGDRLGKHKGDSPIVWLKNIDKVTDSKLKKELLKVVDPSQNTNLGKLEEPIDLSQFTLVATTSTTRPKLSNELRNKLRHIEPFLEKHKWVIFFSSIGVEIIVFVLLIRSQRKSKNKSLKHLEY